MNFLSIARNRFSCRSYTSQHITREVILELMEAARIAPSAVNYQPWEFLIIESDKGRNALVESYPREWFKKAPLYIVACANRKVSWKRGIDGKDHADIDLSIAIDHLTLQAAALGLGTCWVCNFNPSGVKDAFHLPEEVDPLVIIPVGYPAEKSDVTRFDTKRKPIAEILHFEHW